jgi:hypothetical protein
VPGVRLIGNPYAQVHGFASAAIASFLATIGEFLC